MRRLTGPGLRRRLGVFDLSLITVGSIIGSGIFRSPSVVAARAHTPGLIVLAWALGGCIALCGVWISAELTSRRPSEGGFYAYLRDAFHPMVAFIYGWLYLCGIDTGAVAASGVTFANYFQPLTGRHVATPILASTAIAFFTIVNFFGVRQGGTAQNVLAIAKGAGIAVVIVVGLAVFPGGAASQSYVPLHGGTSVPAALGIAMVPVFFAYNGFLSSTYIIGEVKDPKRMVPLGLVIGICIVIPMYVMLNVACLHVLGAQRLGLSKAPASDLMNVALGPIGGRIIAIIVTLSTLGFISTKMLVTPRMYHRMARDGLFFKQISWVHPTTRVPILAIAIQGSVAIIIALNGSFDAIINYIVALDYVFVALAAVALVIFRRRDACTPAQQRVGFKTPGHPYTTGLFFLAVTAVVLDTFISYPRNTVVCAAVATAGVIAYFLWERLSKRPPALTAE